MFAVGVGAGVTLQDMENVASPGRAFHYKDYVDLADIIGQQGGPSSSQPVAPKQPKGKVCRKIIK